MLAFFKFLLYLLSISSALLLIGVIMIQQSKSGGGLGAVSGGAAETMFGTEATNVLTKATTWLAVVFLSSTLVLGAVIGRVKQGESTSVVEKLTVKSAETVKPAEAAKPAEATKPAEPAK